MSDFDRLKAALEVAGVLVIEHDGNGRQDPTHIVLEVPDGSRYLVLAYASAQVDDDARFVVEKKT